MIVGKEGNIGYKDAEGKREYNGRGNSKTSENGYIRKDNGKVIQKPGYSYLDPLEFT